jgi:hypothetical protein
MAGVPSHCVKRVLSKMTGGVKPGFICPLFVAHPSSHWLLGKTINHFLVMVFI